MQNTLKNVSKIDFSTYSISGCNLSNWTNVAETGSAIEVWSTAQNFLVPPFARRSRCALRRLTVFNHFETRILKIDSFLFSFFFFSLFPPFSSLFLFLSSFFFSFFLLFRPIIGRKFSVFQPVSAAGEFFDISSSDFSLERR